MLMCYPSYKECDGVLDCSDGSDEQGCTSVTRECPQGLTACKTGYASLHSSTTFKPVAAVVTKLRK